MENITLSPTHMDAVLEMMKVSQKVANERAEEYIMVHCDLAVAKPALQIQSMETSRSNSLFTAFGPFRILEHLATSSRVSEDQQF